MSIPNFDLINISDKEGSLTPQAKLLFDLLFTTLQNTLSDQGIQPPQINSTTVATLNTAANIGRIIFNTDTSQFMGNKTGTFVNL